MRWELILPRVEPTEFNMPLVCPYKDWQGRRLEHHQEVGKPLGDMTYEAVFAQRYRCSRCGRTSRVYPQGVTLGQTSQRVKGLAVLPCLLGLGYGAVSLALEALGT